MTNPALEWEVNPWRQNLRGAVMSALCVLAIWVALFSLGLHPTTALILCAIATASFYPGLGPMRARVDERGVARRSLFVWERREWADIRRARIGANGLVVSPYKRPRWLDAYRGLFVPLPRDPAEHDRLERGLREWMSEHGL